MPESWWRRLPQAEIAADNGYVLTLPQVGAAAIESSLMCKKCWNITNLIQVHCFPLGCKRMIVQCAICSMSQGNKSFIKKILFHMLKYPDIYV